MRAKKQILQKFMVGIPLVILMTTNISAQRVDGEPIKSVLPRDAIPAIMEPGYVTGEKAEQIMHPEEQILGIVGPNGTAVAYSTWHLDSHEIVNDRIDGAALAVTW